MKYGICRSNCYASTFFDIACNLSGKFVDYEGSYYYVWPGNLKCDPYRPMDYSRVARILTHLAKSHWKVGNRVKDYFPKVIELLEDTLRDTDPYRDWISGVLLEEFGLMTYQTLTQDYNSTERNFMVLYPRGTEFNLEEVKRQIRRIQDPYGIISL